jgi:integrase
MSLAPLLHLISPTVRENDVPPKKYDRDTIKALLGQLTSALDDAVEESTPKLSELWIAYEPSARRLDSHRSIVGRARHVLAFFGEMESGTITLGHIEAYRRKRSLEKTPRGTPPAPGTRNLEIETLLRILNWSVAHKLIRTHQLVRVPMKQIFEKANNVRRTVITEEQLEAILAHAAPWLRAAVLVARDSGMRCKEVMCMRWDQIDWKRGLIFIDSADTKTDEARVTILSERAADAIKQLERSPESPYVFSTASKRGHLRGAHYTPVYFSQCFRNACSKAGVKGPDGDIRLHDTRRTFITKARHAGIDTTEIRRMSGHRTDAAFRRYNVISPVDIMRARGTIEAATEAEKELLREQRRPAKKIEGLAPIASAPRNRQRPR